VRGLFASEPAAWLERQKLDALARLDISAERIEELIAARRQARQEKDLLDTPQGTSWKVK
jgi:cysteinyl-tRNA synthetase